MLFRFRHVAINFFGKIMYILQKGEKDLYPLSLHANIMDTNLFVLFYVVWINFEEVEL